ncbi:MAG TPA: lactate racemase domain-containing protein [Gemmataceae bacterium]|jgi:nickel-dependent lactate racemase|nr:lactate racemase domain-containing protein [Gemmataceae bacterium]
MEIALREYGTTISVPDHTLVVPRRAAPAPMLADVAAAVRSALESPRNFPSLRRALTPEDRITVVVDDRLPQQAAMIGEVLKYLTEAGVVSDSITLLSEPNARQAWVDELSDAYQDVRTEVHDPNDKTRLSYLASTRRGRRIYLNRSLVDADQTIVLAGNRYDPQFGVADGTCLLFPGLSDAATLHDTARQLSLDQPADQATPLRHEAEEVTWLLGVPFLIQVIEGEGESVADVLGGTVESAGDGSRLLDEVWKTTIDRPAHTVVAMVNGSGIQQDFASVAQAAWCASRVVEPGGRILLLSRSNASLTDGMSFVRQADNPAVAARIVQERQPADQVALLQWLHAAGKAELYLLSEMDENVVEELFTTPMQQARQVQRLIDVSPSSLFLEDCQKTLAVIAAK